MKLMFLGAGSAFTVGEDNFQSNMLIVNEQEEKFLIDCGTDIRFSLNAVGFSHLDLTDIYISHLHADHIGGLEYVGFSTKFDPRCSKPKLYISKKLTKSLWNNSLSGGMKSIDGKVAQLETYFDVQELTKDFVWSEIKFTVVPTVHVNDGESLVFSYGLFFNLNEVKIFLTTDTKLCWDENREFYEKADIIFQDCETTPYKSGVHANYQDIVSWRSDIKNKMWLYHYNPGNLPDAKKDGFIGFVKRGQVFDFSDVSTFSSQLAESIVHH